MTSLIHPVILSGGSGKGLWPLSRHAMPKQFLSLGGHEPGLVQTARRLSQPDFAPIRVIAHADHRFLAAHALSDAGLSTAPVVIEPVGRNTAAAIAVAACLEGADDDVLAVFPSDHAIEDVDAFIDAVRIAAAAARDGDLAMLGMPPDRPAPEFGYILPGATAAPGTREVQRFVEKPSAEAAATLVAEGALWNAGVFVARRDLLLAAFREHAPQILERVQAAVAGARPDLDFVRLADAPFREAPSASFDVAIMEQHRGAVVVPCSCGWSDLGSFAALSRRSDHAGDVVSLDVEDCYLHGDGVLVAAAGLRSMTVVATPDVVLVTPTDDPDATRRLVAELESEHRSEAVRHRRVHRPWGSYEGIGSGPRYQVKRLVLRPGGRLSLQRHQRRTEHWVVVSGTARVTRADACFLLGPDQSTYIPLGVAHRLENPGSDPLVMIEVQSGDYLGEDDIVRLDDAYGRVPEEG